MGGIIQKMKKSDNATEREEAGALRILTNTDRPRVRYLYRLNKEEKDEEEALTSRKHADYNSFVNSRTRCGKPSPQRLFYMVIWAANNRLIIYCYHEKSISE